MAIRSGLADSTIMNAKAPMMPDCNFQPGFRIDLYVKDLTNALEAAQATGIELPMASKVPDMMHSLQAEGLGSCDHSAGIMKRKNTSK
ncbi:MAG: NAD-binding protein [Acetivibrionales bacterium]